ncbi:MAG: hypothetical protein AAGU27_03815 [Dehalobacterium sp.]
MELLFVLLVCAGALFIMVRHMIRHFNKSTSCSQQCKNCPEIKASCNQKVDSSLKKGRKNNAENDFKRLGSR